MSPPSSIALFGGTFDPIHQGHIHIAEKAQHQLFLDSVIFLPCRQSPHKLDQKSVDEGHRLKMCELAIQPYPWAQVNDHDITAPLPSYSWKTAEHFKELFPEATLYWLMGTDQWNALHRWARYEYLLSLVSVIVCTRGDRPLENREYAPYVIECSHPASATGIRDAIHSGQNTEWLEQPVKDYIDHHALYGM